MTAKKWVNSRAKAEQQMLAAYFLDVIRPELRQPARRVGRSKAGNRGFQAGETLLGAEAMDLHGTKRS